MKMAARTAARPEQIRRHNLGLLLRHLHEEEELSRSALGRSTGLNRSTIGALVSELTERGMVDEQVSAGAKQGVGRPPFVVAVRPGGAYVVAVDIEVDRVTMSAIGLGGIELASTQWSHAGRDRSPGHVSKRIADNLPALRKHVPDGRLISIGVSIPGTVRTSDGYVANAPNLRWSQVAFGDDLAALTKTPVRVGNDADLAALAEHLRGAARGYDDVICVLGRVGVGGGVLAGGLPLRGAAGYAGEIGHITLNPEGPQCHCGWRGCLEEYIGEPSLVHGATAASLVVRDAHDVFAAADAGDSRAQRVVDDVARWTGRGVASLINVFNPRVIVLAGHLADVLRLAEPHVRAELGHTISPSDEHAVLLEPGALPNASLIGAAELAFEELLDGTAL